jgi:hypothetical protein
MRKSSLIDSQIIFDSIFLMSVYRNCIYMMHSRSGTSRYHLILDSLATSFSTHHLYYHNCILYHLYQAKNVLYSSLLLYTVQGLFLTYFL